MRSVREFYLEEEEEEYFTGFSFKNNVRDSNIERKVVQVIKGEDGKCYDDSGNCYVPNELAVEEDTDERKCDAFALLRIMKANLLRL